MEPVTLDDIEVGRFALRSFSMRFLFASRPQDPILAPISVNDPEAWLNGTCEAVCHRGESREGDILPNGMRAYWLGGYDEPHDSPHERCRCGIYGSFSVKALYESGPIFVNRMVAVIAAEGFTIIGDKGLRTQRARVTAYWVNSDRLSPYGSDTLWYGYQGRLEASRRQFSEADEYSELNDMLGAYGFPGHDFRTREGK